MFLQMFFTHIWLVSSTEKIAVGVYFIWCMVHVIGVGLTLHHLRRTESCDNELEELKPLDQNLQYDFNFQQTNHLPEVINVKRVSK